MAQLKINLDAQRFSKGLSWKDYMAQMGDTRARTEDYYSKAVLTVFVDLFAKGYIYRGKRMVNWCPASQTALSDEEVIMKPVNGVMYRVRYEQVDAPGRAAPPAAEVLSVAGVIQCREIVAKRVPPHVDHLARVTGDRDAPAAGACGGPRHREVF